MSRPWTIANAFVGVVVGAGFASGRELVTFFVAFGRVGLVGASISAAAFTFLGMAVADLGHRLRAASHKDVIAATCGDGPLGSFVDRLILFFMFAVTVVMLAGAGALGEQEFGVPPLVGSALVTALVVAIVCLDVQKVMVAIGAITPLLVVVASGVAIHAMVTTEPSPTEYAPRPEPAVGHWLLSAFVYVSYNLVAGVPILAILGGSSVDRPTAIRGGLLGGLMLGALMLVMSGGLLAREHAAGLPMPMLAIAGEISPLLARVLAWIVLGMIVNTAVGTHYSFLARTFPPGTRAFRAGAIVSGAVAYFGSFVGFTELVNAIYPAFGYLGFALMVAVTLGWRRREAIADVVGSP